MNTELIRKDFEKHLKADSNAVYVVEHSRYLDEGVQAQWMGYQLGVRDGTASLRVILVQQSRIVLLEGFVHVILDGLRHKRIKAKPLLDEYRTPLSLEDFAKRFLL